ncbi:hypothetical protein KR074_007243 [Drosophila pseudoananassae]|nr:hypothetical protein KR074_007243 [Drosophila pseudoananassae]
MKAILIIVVPILLGLAIADETTNDDLEESTIMKALTPKPTTQPGVIMFVKPMKNNHTATHIKKMADDLTSASNPISWQLGFIPRKVKLSFFRFKRDVESSWKHARIQPRMWPPFYDLKDDPLTYPEKNGTSHQKPGYVKLLFVMVHHLCRWTGVVS